MTSPRLLPTASLLALVVSLGAGAAACAEKKPAEGPMERAGRSVDESASKAKNKADEAAKDATEGADEAADDVKKKANDAKK